jgi:prepilin-type N-terminal cleavage/methylation domain-containing protein/prepilin-type processing-associated H-X9-DG protein
MIRKPLRVPYRKAFTLMEVLVVIAIIIVIAALTVPLLQNSRKKANKLEALRRMKDLGAAALTYSAENNGDLPREDSKGDDTWAAAADPENATVWYNALPKLMNKRGVGDFRDSVEDFYTKDNPLYLPGAGYPDEGKRLRQPLYAMAINSKLQRTNPETGKKPLVKFSLVENPARTPLFIEQGLPGEKKDGGIDLQKKSDYDGSPKGSAKSFVGRHFGVGHILFVDGHVQTFEPAELLTTGGEFFYPPSTSRLGLIWCHNSEEDPNK